MAPIKKRIPPRLAFVRTRLPISSIFALKFNCEPAPFSSDWKLAGRDTVVTPIPASEDIYKPDYGDDFHYIDYMEVLAVRPETVSATPVDLEYDETWDDEEDWARPSEEPRPSFNMERMLDCPGIFDVPAFGRRMLLVGFEPELDDRAIERAKVHIRRQMGRCAVVWPGRSFQAYCFTDNRTPAAIMAPLFDILDCNEVADYLLVQPTELLMQDGSGLSPLAEWMDHGWRDLGVSTPGHRTARSGRR